LLATETCLRTGSAAQVRTRHAVSSPPELPRVVRNARTSSAY
jgi:hypothetical protein